MINKELETRMQMAQDVTSMVLALRRKVNIKVRQPLQCIMVPVLDERAESTYRSCEKPDNERGECERNQVRRRCGRCLGKESEM